MRIVHLKKTYNSRTVLNIDECIFEKGKVYAVVGANGSGKSTLLKCIAKTQKSDNKNFLFIDKGESVGYMPQSSFAFKMSLMKNLFVGCKKNELSVKVANEYIDRFDLSDKIKTRADRLSGGEKQKMALIRLVMNKYDYILLDEPTCAMDAYSTYEAEKVIKEYCKENNACVIIVTHSIKQAQRIADEIIFMNEGVIAEHSSVKEFINEPKTESAKEFLEFFGA